jgi:predicted metalloprotease with PDZ domain
MGSSIAESSLDERQAFLSPTSLFLHPTGRIGTPVTVTVAPREGWPRISTGLDPVSGQPNTFSAPDFDILYDSPILVGNQEVLSFEVNGIPHTFEGRDLGKLDRVRFTADLKAMVKAATDLMGDIPYERYAFISIGPGGGGLEHLNSQLITFDAVKMADPVEYRRTLRFIAHEYFHHFNVKRIRPIALGPFDYDRENYTRMMWVSEGFTVYYEDLLLVRNGFTPREEYLERLGLGLSAYESSPGRRFQSPAESSFDSWFGYFARSEHLRNTTVSPYDSGLALALLIDFRIRHETRNRRSLDDVMRMLYRTWAKEKRRGFTDEEFRRVCEDAAGVPLAEIFDRYVVTTAEIDYARHLAYGGLEVADEEVPDSGDLGGDLGADLEERSGKVIVTRVGLGSGASLAGLSATDEVLAVDAVRGDVARIRELLSGRRPGETVKLLVSRHGKVRELNVTLGSKTVRSFRLRRLPGSTPLQSAIYESWLTGR